MNVDMLFEPFELKGLCLRNRFVMPPMQKHEPPDRIPTREMASYYAARAKGGVALLLTQGTAVDHFTSQAPYAAFIPPAYDGWRRCVQGVRNEGGHLFLQLWHEGANRVGGYGPSGISSWGEAIGYTLTRAQISELVEAHAAAAIAAKGMGFSGVEIHAAHGYLVDQFLWDVTNRRSDDYGGPPENRARFAVEIIRAVRAAVGPDFPIGLRLSQWKTRNYDAHAFARPEDLASLLDQLTASGVDYFHASTRRFWTPEFGGPSGLAGWVKRLSRQPVIAVGSVGLSKDIVETFAGDIAEGGKPENLGRLIDHFSRGEFDLVAVGRALLTDPDWVLKLRDGQWGAMKSTVSTADVLSDLNLPGPS